MFFEPGHGAGHVGVGVASLDHFLIPGYFFSSCFFHDGTYTFRFLGVVESIC